MRELPLGNVALAVPDVWEGENNHGRLTHFQHAIIWTE